MKFNSREVGRKKKAFQPEEGKREDKIRSPFFSLEMDEGALSGKQLSLLNYALISLAGSVLTTWLSSDMILPLFLEVRYLGDPYQLHWVGIEQGRAKIPLGG